MASSLTKKSGELLLLVKNEAEVSNLLDELAHLSLKSLEEQLINDTYKLVFWINIYNSFYQILNKVHQLTAPKIYTSKQIQIAGYSFSLDHIEHGILRKFRYKYSLGYVPNIFIPSMIKKLAVDVIDYRIHFALNCGAKSCPAIRFYSVKDLDQQLDLATSAFLESETKIDAEKREVKITRLFLWFHKDFGGNKGIRKILKNYLHQDFEGYKMKFKNYSWDIHLDNYVEGSFPE
ncbi:DUF547 domain-containing protein [Lutimonas zeaxanthinifaciens]|uniref:DUF547 domain-containing protein n=1 Tax=Lutimonas zeaxanthinifaciens TaxID=3060215 RepID=UPI00265CF8F1|nr:DUF547 domain-containing protein [Lutimonas sp. YSD2104]WKK65685.1 DUF547 domain-containing protein [Lutimonas sp. YSD2104]